MCNITKSTILILILLIFNAQAQATPYKASPFASNPLNIQYTDTSTRGTCRPGGCSLSFAPLNTLLKIQSIVCTAAFYDIASSGKVIVATASVLNRNNALLYDLSPLPFTEVARVNNYTWVNISLQNAGLLAYIPSGSSSVLLSVSVLYSNSSNGSLECSLTGATN